ncbi:vesicle transport protein USE1-like protein [Leptotrombidium deliense]|uniref:Vesicle transport protein USE1 n=1 Tax=Leptotrombidium deliense TaxID=299467 RepID=A0A443S3P3_9ACAR|nr:vesicle transport protein USE1-like protein [Leptotrombidium deliense]
MAVSDDQVDFCRLLVKCEALLSQPRHEWRVTKFISALNDRLNRLSNTNVMRPSDEQLQELTKKLNFLKGVLQVERLETSSQKLMATQLLSPVLSPQDQRVHTKTKEIYLQSQAKYANEVRTELLGTDSDRLRTGKSGSDDVDAVLKHHHSVQERVAEEMIALTRNLKENALMASHIIKKDTECLQKTGELAAKNFDNLRKSNDVITDFVKRSCQYWLWIMLALVSLTFLWMVVFIRIFPKRY